LGQQTLLENVKTCKKSSFLCLCYIFRAIRADRCRERRYADHTFIQIHFRMHHFVVKFSKKQFRLRRHGGIDPLTKILRTFLGVSHRRKLSRRWLTRPPSCRASRMTDRRIGLHTLRHSQAASAASGITRYWSLVCRPLSAGYHLNDDRQSRDPRAR